MLLKFYPLLLLFFLGALWGAENYHLGQGYKFSDSFVIGGYITSEYEVGETQESFKIDDIALLVYGQLNKKLSYLAEFENRGIYEVNLRQENTLSDTTVNTERLYLDYTHSDTLNFRLGKQITPIGYWAAQPISVLRDTASNPVFSTTMYPKYFTGLDLYGFLPFAQSTQYHMLFQNNTSLDSSFDTIQADHFVALALDSELSMNWHIGGSFGHFITLTDDDSYFLQLNTHYDMHPFILTAELIRNQTYYVNQDSYTRLGAFYIQLLFQQSNQHSWVTRLEHSRTPSSLTEESFVVLGYSYRPLYPIALRAEYQFHEDESLNYALFSFAVLF